MKDDYCSCSRLAPHIKVMSPKTLQTRLLASSEASKQKLVEEIGKVEYVCLTADIWSDRSSSFMGMTAHWIENLLHRPANASEAPIHLTE